MKKIYQTPDIIITDVIYELAIAQSRLVGGGPLDDEVKPFPSLVQDDAADDGMMSSHGQGSGGAGNRSNTGLWED